MITQILDDYPSASLILAGDFNIDTLRLTDASKTYKATLQEFGLTNLIQEATRVTEQSSTCLDHIWVSDPDKVHFAELITGIADHHAIVASISGKLKLDEKLSITYRDMKNFDHTAFERDIATVPWETALIFDEPDDQYSHFIKMFSEVLDIHAPMKTSKAKKPDKASPPWPKR